MTHAQLMRLAQSLGKLVQKELPPRVGFALVLGTVDGLLANVSNLPPDASTVLLRKTADKLEEEVKT